MHTSNPQTIVGRVTQIIPPKDHDKYFYGIQGVHTARGMYLVHVLRPDIPKSFLERLRFWWKHRKEAWCWTIVMDECSYCVGELVRVDVVPFLPAVELWTTKQN